MKGKKTTFLHYAPLSPTNSKKGQPEKEKKKHSQVDVSRYHRTIKRIKTGGPHPFFSASYPPALKDQHTGNKGKSLKCGRKNPGHPDGKLVETFQGQGDPLRSSFSDAKGTGKRARQSISPGCS
jgi:hypothetical protein